MSKEKIVVSGISGIFPKSKNVAEFYTNLNDKKQLFSPVDPYWKVIAPGIAPIIGIQPLQTKFDAGYFGVHYKQAEDMHQCCRKLLELSVEAIMDSGTNPLDLKGTNTGVFVANSGIESKSEWIWQKLASPNFAMFGSTQSAMADQISYCLELQGPSVTVDSTCAGSLYVLDHAVAAIKSGRCNSALVCGAHVVQNPNVHYEFQLWGVLDKNGEGNVFDDSSVGYIRSEATSVIFVQKLQDARRTYAEILNVKTNSDGFKEAGIAHPSLEMMADVFRKTYDDVGVDPTTVDFIEGHITGTVIGFVEEIKAIEKTFCTSRKTSLLVGSVKANIGHCEGVSGFASMFKILLGLQHNCILPNPDCQRIKSGVEAVQNGKIVLATERISLPSDQDVIIGCNNSGFGGTNGHLALKYHHRSHTINHHRYPNRLVCFTARTMSSLTKIFTSLAENPTEDYATLLQNIFRRNYCNHWYRGYVILNNGEVLQNSLNFSAEKPKLCLIYPQTNQDWLRLFDDIQLTSTLSESIERVRKILLPKGVDVLILWKQKQAFDVGDLVVATVVLQLAITDMLKDVLQTKIDVVQGFSSGAIASAYARGTLQLEDAMIMALKLANRLQKCKNTEIGTLKELRSLWKAEENAHVKLTPNIVTLVIGPDDYYGQLSLCPKTSFLDILGRLYVLGFDLHLDKLYPRVFLPVKAPLVSPLIQWQHEDSWHVLRYQLRHKHRKVVTISLDNNYWKFLSGHVIDGRTLLPTTASLHIVWKFYLQINSLLLEKTKIVFENVKFHRMTVLSKQKPLVLTVDITKVQNNFEIREGNDCLVTGRIRSSASDYEFVTNFAVPSQRSSQRMIAKDIYKKLSMNGYNYKNAFCCLQEANLDGTVGRINWKNWTTFLDAMGQLLVLNTKLDHLYVPIRIDKLVVHPQELAQARNKYNDLLPVYYELNSNTIMTPGVQIHHCSVSTIKKRLEEDPILGVHKFVPFDTDLTLEDSITVHIQLVLENLDDHLRVTELVDSFSNDKLQLLSPIVDEVLKNENRVDRVLSIYTNKNFDYPNITVEESSIEGLKSNVNLVILSQGVQRPKVVAKILENRNCFLLSREARDFDAYNHAEVISVHRTDFESLVLMRKSTNVVKRVIDMKANFRWLGQLQSALHDNQKVLLVAQNDSDNGVLGLVSCLRREVGQNVSCLFISDTVREFDVADEFYQRQLQKNLLVNVFKDGAWGSYRHLRLQEDKKDCARTLDSSSHLSSAHYIKGPLTEHSSSLDETLVDIYYAGVKFKDVTTVDASVFDQHRSNGVEFAGKDSRGHRIMGITKSGAFSSYTSIPQSFICTIPDEWSMEEAATVPVVYLKVLYALIKISRLRPGQSILIHSGTDSVGLSAINTALHYNCNIFTTIRSEEKRKYLKHFYPSIPDSHIGNSRDRTFEQMVLKQTKGKGVDIVLHSSTEDKCLTSTQCLARKGFFLELRNYNPFLNTPLSVNEFVDGRTYAGIYMDMFLDTDPFTKAQIMSLLRHGINEGYVKPLPRVVYSEDEVLRNVSLGKQTGKISLQLINKFPRPLRAKPRFQCIVHKVYIIIGGLSGFGIELAHWLVGRGARKLVLVSKTSAFTGYLNYKLSYWKKLGCKVLVTENDLVNEENCIKLLTEVSELGDVDGIFNLATAFHDALIQNQTKETFKTALEPKASITKSMDKFSRKFCPHLRQFVVFSSFVCGRGSLGQTNYGMANSIVERICEQRKKEGYPALAIQWGLIEDLGLVAENLRIDGLLEQKISSCLNVLDTLLTQDEVVVSSTVFDRKKTMQKSKAQEFLNSIVEILAIPNINHVSVHSTLPNLGMDSTSIVELRQFLSEKCSLYFTPSELRTTTLHMLIEKNNARVN